MGASGGWRWQMGECIWTIIWICGDYLSRVFPPRLFNSIGLVLSCLIVSCLVWRCIACIATPPVALLYYFLTAYGKSLVEEGGVLERHWLRCRCAARLTGAVRREAMRFLSKMSQPLTQPKLLNPRLTLRLSGCLCDQGAVPNRQPQHRKERQHQA